MCSRAVQLLIWLRQSTRVFIIDQRPTQAFACCDQRSVSQLRRLDVSQPMMLSRTRMLNSGCSAVRRLRAPVACFQVTPLSSVASDTTSSICLRSTASPGAYLSSGRDITGVRTPSCSCSEGETIVDEGSRKISPILATCVLRSKTSFWLTQSVSIQDGLGIFRLRELEGTV